MTPGFPDRMRVAVAQYDVIRDDPPRNQATIERLLRQTELGSIDILVLPEMWARSFCGPTLADEAGRCGERIDWLAALARRQRCWIAGATMPTRSPTAGCTGSDRVRNTLVIIDDRGEVRYRFDKMHLFPLTGEDRWFEAGSEVPPPLAIGAWRVGAGICFDVRFPELFRRQMRDGANLFLLPAQLPEPRTSHFTLLSQARAVENLAPVIAANRIGTEDKLQHAGASQIVNALGTVLARADATEVLLVAELDVREVEQTRRRSPFLDAVRLL